MKKIMAMIMAAAGIFVLMSASPASASPVCFVEPNPATDTGMYVHAAGFSPNVLYAVSAKQGGHTGKGWIQTDATGAGLTGMSSAEFVPGTIKVTVSLKNERAVCTVERV